MCGTCGALSLFVSGFGMQSVVFDDIDFSEHVRLEVRGMRKLGENPVLASLDFEVMKIMS